MSYFDETLKDWVRTQQVAAGLSSVPMREFEKRNKKILSLIGDGVTRRSISSIIERVKKLDASTKKKIMQLITGQLADIATITYRNEEGNIKFLDIVVAERSYDAAKSVNLAMKSPVHGNRTVGGLLSDVFGNANDTAINILRRSISEGSTFNETRSMFVTQMGVDNRHLSNVIATAVNATANEARNEFYQANSDVIRRVLWRSTLDIKTSDICQDLDGKLWEPGEPHPNPPAHVNCRSFLVPVPAGMSDKEARSMLRPAVADGEAKRTRQPTYGEWLKRQSAGFQKQVLGKRRYEMLRDGELSFDRFFAKDGKFLTIKQLEEKL